MRTVLGECENTLVGGTEVAWLTVCVDGVCLQLVSLSRLVVGAVLGGSAGRGGASRKEPRLNVTRPGQQGRCRQYSVMVKGHRISILLDITAGSAPADPRRDHIRVRALLGVWRVHFSPGNAEAFS